VGSAISAVDDDGVCVAVSSGRLGDKEQSNVADRLVVQLVDPLAQAWCRRSSELEQERVVEAGERCSARRGADEIVDREEPQADRCRAPLRRVERLTDSSHVARASQPGLRCDRLGRRSETA
jgi:hypothetical protein